MKKLLIFLIVVGILAGAAKLAQPKVTAWWEEKNKVEFETVALERGPISWNVQSTGKVEPILKIQIGSFVSGPIVELNADYNTKVEKGDVLAEVDPRLYKAAVERDNASLALAKAGVERVDAQLQQAINDLKRAEELQAINEDYISQSEMDQLCFARKGLVADKKVAELQIKQALANLENSKLNLEYTLIEAPESGVIIERKINPGQTLAAQFQSPELFVLAPQMDERMWVHASVVEADVGHIIRAKKEERKVEFYVEAYEDELFEGKILQVRQNPDAEQSVVSYPVIVETTNENLKLLPGMTAFLSFEIETNKDALKIPREAITFVPTDKKHVREEDHKILDGKEEEQRDADAGEGSAEQRIAASRRRRTRYVWVKDGEKLKAVKIKFGITDGRDYELVEGDLEEGQELVSAIKGKNS